MDPQQLPMSELQSEDAALLGDLSLIVLDLRSVLDICRRPLCELEKTQQDPILIEALWTGALVRYSRCFTSGKRFQLKLDVFEGLDGDPVGAHQYFKNMRDKHVAHSVNPFEEVRVGVMLSAPSTQPPAIEGVAVLSRKLVSGTSDGVRTLLALASAVHKSVSCRARQVQDDLLEWAKKQPVSAFPPGHLGLVTPGPEQIDKPRIIGGSVPKSGAEIA